MKPRVLVVRGDLRTHYGYSRALRAHLELLAPFFDRVIGVDLHYTAGVSRQPFNWEVMPDHQVDSILDQASNDSILLNYTIPEEFRRYPGVLNIGYFYWETDRFAPSLNWRSYLSLMDAMWLPVSYLEKAVRSAGFMGPVSIIPWPQKVPAQKDASQLSHRMPELYAVRKSGSLSRIRIASDIGSISEPIPKFQRQFFYEVLGGFARRQIQRRKASLETIRKNYRHRYLSVLQNVPRKGVRLLISEWLEYLSERKESSCLILKVSSLNPKVTREFLYLEIHDQIERLARSQSIEVPDVYLALDYLSEDQLDYLYRDCSCLISTSLGEGFGGPVVEAAFRDIPVITPLHSSYQDLIPPEYPLCLPAEKSCVSMIGQLHYYTHSAQWGVIRPRSLVEKLLWFESNVHEVENMASTLKNHLVRVCGIDAVKQCIVAALEKLNATSA